jgi:hypothetical protein
VRPERLSYGALERRARQIPVRRRQAYALRTRDLLSAASLLHLCGHAFRTAQGSQNILAGNLLDIILAITASQQLGKQVGIF